MKSKENIKVEVFVNATPETVWNCWTDPGHITKWNFASDDWCCPSVKSDLREGGKYSARMEACDGSIGFDFICEFVKVEPLKRIEMLIEDGRLVKVVFEEKGGKTVVSETFEAENTHPIDMQRAGWQAILDNFKKHAESH